jgi:hypothetical protein
MCRRTWFVASWVAVSSLSSRDEGEADMGFDGQLSDADRACMHERDDERDIEVVSAKAHDEQLLDAIGDSVYDQMHAPSFNRDAMTAWQRVQLQRTLFAYMNDRVLWDGLRSIWGVS